MNWRKPAGWAKRRRRRRQAAARAIEARSPHRDAGARRVIFVSHSACEAALRMGDGRIHSELCADSRARRGFFHFLFAGSLSIASTWQALLPAALYIAIHLIGGETATPMLLPRRFTLNPVLVVFSFVFWFWLWGAPGAIPSAPILATIKIVCDRIRPLAALGHILAG
jgi:hypothetical protein